ncbi:MAG TPA: hypothetical protein VIU61_08570, partial [Kofleriaceae bacterium]
APQPELAISKAPEPPPPPAPLDTQWMLIEDVPDPGLHATLQALLRPFSSALSVCVAIDSLGRIHATRTQDETGARVTDAEVDKQIESLTERTRDQPIAIRPETATAIAGTWLCNRARGAAPPMNVAPTMLEGRRIAGDRNILPDDATKTEIQRSGKERVLGSWKMCIDERGEVTEVKVLKTTGFPAYDTKIETAIKAWQYKPYLTPVGRAIPVCTAVTFIYSQK